MVSPCRLTINNNNNNNNARNKFALHTSNYFLVAFLLLLSARYNQGMAIEELAEDLAELEIPLINAQQQQLIQQPQQPQIDMSSTLDCHRRLYTYKVQREDNAGRVCWDSISVMSCWGRCDSNEISDWRFPYKRSFHPVCMHDERRMVTVTLQHCDEGVTPGTERYIYYEALTCRCAVCKSSEASCEGLRYRGQRSGTMPNKGR